jgi:hypothetical protein
MRSELVFGAMTYVSNRFLLSRVAAQATRKLHRPNTRIQDTANEVLERFRHTNPLAVVSCTGNRQPFARIAQVGTHPYEDLEQSVA